MPMRFAFIAAFALSIVREPNHAVLLQNLKARVLVLKLPPNAATKLHRHDGFYAFVSLQPATLSNTVPGHAPKITELKPGELHTSRGGFELIEQNISTQPAKVLVVELLNPAPAAFDGSLVPPKFQKSLYSELFEVSGMRAYSMMVDSEGKVEEREQKYDRVLLAITKLSFRRSLDGQAADDLELQPGEVRWLPRGGSEEMVNAGNTIARFIMFEFS